MIKAIIFDFEGPIVNWEAKGRKVYDKHEEHRNLERDTIRNLFKEYFRGGHVGKFHTLADFVEKTKPPIDITIEELNEILGEVNSAMHLRPKMIAYVKELKKKYKIALVSNFTSELEELLRELFDVYHLFDLVINSYNLEVKKPDSRIYKHALKKLGVQPEETAFIDDLEENVRGAEAIGIKGIVFKNFKQCKSDLENILNN
jgi:putative hydrolase of the HAD superfamily